MAAESMKLGETRILHFEEDENKMKHCTISRKGTNLFEIFITHHNGRVTTDIGSFEFSLQQLRELKFWLS